MVILPIYDELGKRGLKPRVMVGDHMLEEKKIRKARRRYLGKENILKRELIPGKGKSAVVCKAILTKLFRNPPIFRSATALAHRVPEGWEAYRTFVQWRNR